MLGDQNPAAHFEAGRADAETETETDQSAIDGMLALGVGMSLFRRRQRCYWDYWNRARRAGLGKPAGKLNCRWERRFPGQDRSRLVLNDFCDGFRRAWYALIANRGRSAR